MPHKVTLGEDAFGPHTLSFETRPEALAAGYAHLAHAPHVSSDGMPQKEKKEGHAYLEGQRKVLDQGERAEYGSAWAQDHTFALMT